MTNFNDLQTKKSIANFLSHISGAAMEAERTPVFSNVFATYLRFRFRYNGGPH